MADWLRQLVRDGFKPNEIAIFGRTDVLVADVAGSAVKIAGMAAHKLVDDEPPLGEDVFIGTMHRAKGLEFKAVAVVGVDCDHVPLRVVVESLDDVGDRIAQGEQERQLLYVACSRARERLYISYTGQPSTFLSESASKH